MLSVECFATSQNFEHIMAYRITLCITCNHCMVHSFLTMAIIKNKNTLQCTVSLKRPMTEQNWNMFIR